IGDAQSALFSAVQASSGITTKCITVKTKAAATYAQCAAKVASRLATGQLRGISPKTTVSYALFNYLKCVSKLGKVDDVCAFPVPTAPPRPAVPPGTRRELSSRRQFKRLGSILVGPDWG